MFEKLVLLSAIFGISLGLQLTSSSYTPCHATTTIQSIDVTPCDAEPCKFTKGTNVNIVTKFTPNEASNGCKVKMEAQLGQWVPIIDRDVCGNGLTCPLTPGSVNQVNFVEGVDNRLPDGQTLTRWKLICDSGATEAFCADVQVVIQ